MEFSLAAGQEHDFELALLALGEGGAGDLDLAAIGGRVLDVERAAAAYLEAIVEGRTGGEAIGPEAGVGVIDFKKLDGSAGAVFDGGVDVVGVAGGEVENEDEAGGKKPVAGRSATRHLPGSS